MTDDYQTIADIWSVLAYTDWQDLEQAATEFVDDYTEPRRVADCLYPESMSTLHRVRPDMLLMVHKGASLLSHWWHQKNRPPWHVLPLAPLPEPPEKVVILMETMPDAFLRSTRLPYQRYKGPGPEDLQNRDRIINELADVSGIALAQCGRVPLCLPCQRRLPGRSGGGRVCGILEA